MKRLSILLPVVLALALAACGGDDASSAEPSEAPASAEPSVAASVEPSEEPSAAPSADGEEPTGSQLAIPSFDLNGDPELAARFPDSVGGEPLTMQSVRGDVFEQMGGGGDPALQAFLTSLDAEMSDMSVAFGSVMTGEEPLSVGAFRIAGASEDDLEREFVNASEAAGGVSDLEETTLAGKDVLSGADPSGETGLSMYVYTKDDTLYFITGSEEQATEILEALP